MVACCAGGGGRCERGSAWAPGATSTLATRTTSTTTSRHRRRRSAVAGAAVARARDSTTREDTGDVLRGRGAVYGPVESGSLPLRNAPRRPRPSSRPPQEVSGECLKSTCSVADLLLPAAPGLVVLRTQPPDYDAREGRRPARGTCVSLGVRRRAGPASPAEPTAAPPPPSATRGRGRRWRGSGEAGQRSQICIQSTYECCGQLALAAEVLAARSRRTAGSGSGTAAPRRCPR